MKKQSVIVDLDYTIANPDHRINIIKENENNLNWDIWTKFHDLTYLDEPIIPIIDIVKGLSKNYNIIISTSRHEYAKELSLKWIEEKALTDIEIAAIYMRGDYDTRKDEDQKFDCFIDMITKNLNPVLAIDDKESVVKMYQQFIPVLQPKGIL